MHGNSRAKLWPLVQRSAVQIENVAMAEETLTIDVPTAGRRYFGLSRNGSYNAAKRKEIPTIKIGRKLRVPIRALEVMLNKASPK